MQTVSALYQQIMSGEHYAERKINIAGTDYGEDTIVSLTTTGGLFADGTLSVGSAVSREINLSLWNISTTIPKMAKLIPYYRISNGTQTSEWVQKGVFYIDTRSVDSGLLTIHGYDDMLKAEQIWTPDQSLEFPMPMTQVVDIIANIMGVEIDARTVLNSSYTVDYPANDYTLRDVLRFIAAAHGGNWIMSDVGELWLVGLNDLPTETNYLCDEDGDWITFGGDRILV
mgnify:FL=1